MFKNMRLLILFNMHLSPNFKMTTNVANIARTATSTSKFIYLENFKSLGTGSLYEKKFLILNELKTSLVLKFSLQDSLQTLQHSNKSQS